MLRPESGRGREQDHIDAAVDDLVVGVEAEERLVDLDAGAEFLAALQPRRRALDNRLVYIGDGGQLSVRVGTERLSRGPAAAAARAHEPDLERVGDGLAGNDRRKPSGKD